MVYRKGVHARYHFPETLRWMNLPERALLYCAGSRRGQWVAEVCVAREVGEALKAYKDQKHTMLELRRKRAEAKMYNEVSKPAKAVRAGPTSLALSAPPFHLSYSTPVSG